MAIREFTDDELTKLDISRRNLLVAHVSNGRSYEDCAADFNIPLGTVKSRINRARGVILRLREASAQKAAA